MGAGSLSVHAHRSRAHPRKLANPQHDWPVANLPGTAVHHGWRLPGGAKQREDSGWVRACEATTHLSPHRTPQARQNSRVHAVDTARAAGSQQAEAMASGVASWLQEAGCGGVSGSRSGAGGVGVFHGCSGGGARRRVFDSAWSGRRFLWQVQRPETGVEGLQKPMVRQVSTWQL